MKKRKKVIKADSSHQISLRVKPEEKQMLESAYALYVSRVPNPMSKSGYYRNLLLESLNMNEESTDPTELYVSTDKIKTVKDLSNELNILINNLDDDNQTMSSLIRVVGHLKFLTGYKRLPDGELISTPSIPYLDAKSN